MTLRERIVNYLTANPGIRFTNGQLADMTGAPMPSVRRASLTAMLNGQILDGGPASYNASVVTYVVPEAGL